MITRVILWNIPEAFVITLYVASALCAIWIFAWFTQRARRWGPRTEEPAMSGGGLGSLADYLLTHRTLRRDRYAGAMHLLIFWGFTTELVATTLVAIQHHLHLSFLVGTAYLLFSLVSDLGGLALALGLAMALWRRRSPASHGRLRPDYAIQAVLWLLLFITISGFLLEGERIAVDFPPFERWSVVGFAVARLFSAVGINGETAAHWHRATWGLHAVAAVTWLGLVPLTMMRHVVLGAYNVARTQPNPGKLVDNIRFRRSDWMQADACLTCGRCAQVCPAEAAGKPLSPRAIVLGLREALDRRTSAAAVIPDAAIWSCTSCHACDDACPIHIPIVDKIMTLRREAVLDGRLAETAAEALESTAQKYNPFSKPNSARLEWAAGLNVPVANDDEPRGQIDLLYWVGCAGAFDPAGKEVTRAMVRILQHLQVPFKTLGCGERCTGDPARRLGEEGLWRELAETNQAKFRSHGVKTILTSCPHCFNSLRHEYPAVGPMPEVLHHSQWLRARIEEGRLRIGGRRGERITFHDPCYLSRAGNEIEAPRAILDALADKPRVEIAPHGRQSQCCGGGGGQMWLDVRGTTRPESRRAAQVEATGAQVVASGCPFCRVMLEAGRLSLPEGQGKWQVRDLAELVVESLPS